MSQHGRWWPARLRVSSASSKITNWNDTQSIKGLKRVSEYLQDAPLLSRGLCMERATHGSLFLFATSVSLAVTHILLEQESGGPWLMTALGHTPRPASGAPEGHPRIAQRFIAGCAALEMWLSPGGTAGGPGHESWPVRGLVQSSLRDSVLLKTRGPSDKSLGYFHQVPPGRELRKTALRSPGPLLSVSLIRTIARGCG